MSHFKVKNSVAFNECNHHFYLVPKYFYYPKRKTYQLISSAPFFQSLTTTNIFSVSMNLPSVNISYKQNHTKCNYVCLDSFIYHNVLKVHPFVACINTSFIFLWLNPFPLYVYHFSICLSLDGHLDCFHLLIFMTGAPINIQV